MLKNYKGSVRKYCYFQMAFKDMIGINQCLLCNYNLKEINFNDHIP